MIDKKIGIIVAVVLVVVAAWYIVSQGRQYGPSAGPVTASPTPTAEPTGIAPVSEGGGANMETPDIQTGAPNENLDLGSLV